ncbi:50S ribosomal protein L4 [Streptomyces kaempferi]
MSTIDIQSPSGDTAGTVELPAEIFDVEKISIPLLHQVVVAQLAAARQGTHKVKRRGEVRGGGRSLTARRAPAAPVRVRPARRSSPRWRRSRPHPA